MQSTQDKINHPTAVTLISIESIPFSVEYPDLTRPCQLASQQQNF